MRIKLFEINALHVWKYCTKVIVVLNKMNPSAKGSGEDRLSIDFLPNQFSSDFSELLVEPMKPLTYLNRVDASIKGSRQERLRDTLSAQLLEKHFFQPFDRIHASRYIFEETVSCIKGSA